jgi:hypothetical protein
VFAWAYVLICAVIPPLWAVAVVRFLDTREARKARFKRAEKPTSDYSI